MNLLEFRSGRSWKDNQHLICSEDTWGKCYVETTSGVLASLDLTKPTKRTTWTSNSVKRVASIAKGMHMFWPTFLIASIQTTHVYTQIIPLPPSNPVSDRKTPFFILPSRGNARLALKPLQTVYRVSDPTGVRFCNSLQNTSVSWAPLWHTIWAPRRSRVIIGFNAREKSCPCPHARLNYPGCRSVLCNSR